MNKNALSISTMCTWSREEVVDVDFRIHPGRRCRSENIMPWEIECRKNTSPPGDVMMIYSEM